jgi:D-glycero-D-manno-heptose 1,7-bisphosphate phosphatase
MKNKSKKKDILIALDRDGTLIYDDEGYFGKNDNWKKKIRFYDDAIEAIKTLKLFAKVIVATNQIGVARGLYNEQRVKEIHQYINEQLREQGVQIDGWYFSPYVEKIWAEKNGLDANNPWALDRFPETRKPEIGMLKQAAADFNDDPSSYRKIFVIGDSLDDVNMGLNASGISVFLNNGKNHHLIQRVESLQVANPGRVFIVNNLFSATKIVERTV